MIAITTLVRRRVAALLLAGLSVEYARAEPPAATAKAAPDADDLAQRASRALQRDAELDPLDLGVKARPGGVVVLWGNYPSEAVAAKAEALLRKLPGVASVVRECTIDAGTDPDVAAIVKRLRPDLDEQPTTAPVVAAKPPTPSAVEGIDEVRGAVTVSRESAKHDVGRPAALGLPVGRVGTEQVADAVERLRQSDARYRGLTLKVDGGTVYVGGTAAKYADVYEVLYPKLSAVPGVGKILVRGLAVK